MLSLGIESGRYTRPVTPITSKLLSILCPVNTEIAMCVSKYLKIITETRVKLDQGLSDTMLKQYCKIYRIWHIISTLFLSRA